MKKKETAIPSRNSGILKIEMKLQNYVRTTAQLAAAETAILQPSGLKFKLQHAPMQL